MGSFLAYDGVMAILASRLRVACAAAVGFVAPAAFVACDLVPLPVADTTGSSTSGSTGGSGGAGGASTSGTGGGGGTGAGTTGSSGGAGAGGASTSGTGGDGGGGGGSTSGTGAGGANMDGGSACGAILTTFPIDPSPHVAACSVVTYSTNPPTSGPHYPSWAAFKTYTTPVPRGFYVHSMEHGAVVIQFNCPAGCDAELAALLAYLDARPADPLCVAPLKNRFIVTPDPLLDVPFAASAWGASLKAECFDLPALGQFIDAYYAKAPENFCFDGFDPTAPGSGVPADCGQPVDGGSD